MSDSKIKLTKEWPTEPGLYYFFGGTDIKNATAEEITIIQVYDDMSSSDGYSHFSFLDQLDGYWAEVDLDMFEVCNAI